MAIAFQGFLCSNPRKIRQKGGLFSIPLCHTIETRKTNVYLSPRRSNLSAANQLHIDVVQLIGGRFFKSQKVDAHFPYQAFTRMYRIMMKVVSFTGGAAGVYAVLRAIVTGNASG